MVFEVMPLIPVSWGEVFDKITILEIKEGKISDSAKLANISRELFEINKVVGALGELSVDVVSLIGELKVVNSQLWDIEDGKRACERNKEFDSRFIELARQVYLKNDLRASIKKKINALLGSVIVEEKSYAQY